MSQPVSPYRIHVEQSVLDDLRERLVRTRWPDAVADDWERGVRPSDQVRLVEHWRDGFDWRAVEDRLASYEHLRVVLPEGGVHVLRAGTPGRLPVLLLHGWPDSFLRFEKALPHLAAEVELVVPSIPGYGFSDRPTTAGVGAPEVARRMGEVMAALGHERYVVHGGDIGTAVAEGLALLHPDRVVGLHLTDVPLWRVRGRDPEGMSPTEQEYLRQVRAWTSSEGAYLTLQSTKPQTLAYGLLDSPSGLAAWFLEKFRAWSDCGGDVWNRFTLDELATNATIYWVTQTAGSAARLYYDNAHVVRDACAAGSHSSVPAAIAAFPHDILSPPRSLAEQSLNLVRWTQLPRGGHFGAWEEPELFAADLLAFVRDDLHAL